MFLCRLTGDCVLEDVAVSVAVTLCRGATVSRDRSAWLQLGRPVSEPSAAVRLCCLLTAWAWRPPPTPKQR
jgi:hypothetical protein